MSRGDSSDDMSMLCTAPADLLLSANPTPIPASTSPTATPMIHRGTALVDDLLIECGEVLAVLVMLELTLTLLESFEVYRDDVWSAVLVLGTVLVVPELDTVLTPLVTVCAVVLTVAEIGALIVAVLVLGLTVMRLLRVVDAVVD